MEFASTKFAYFTAAFHLVSTRITSHEFSIHASDRGWLNELSRLFETLFAIRDAAEVAVRVFEITNLIPLGFA